MKYVLVCESEIVNNLCPTGFKSVLLSEITPQFMTLAEFQALAPYTLTFLATCWVWKKLR
ncbi:hypothetical protein TUMSATVNIG2_16430 [Vibrio nigripulchritudo]|nr:hypothetical protein TUMSATVNIG2_16430 [Vibrio nigripulchritudo]